MTDLIVFRVGTNRYALRIENIQRIIQAEILTNMPNAKNFIDGVMSYENSVIKVLNFRNLIGMNSYDEELIKFFGKLKLMHEIWLEALKFSVDSGAEFRKIMNAHECELGKWIDSFTSYDESISSILNELTKSHKHLHSLGENILDLYKSDKEEAQRLLDRDLQSTFYQMMSALKAFTNNIEVIANSLQKLIIYENKNKIFAIKVDAIEDIAHITEDKIMKSSDEDIIKFLDLDGVLDLDGILINVIKTVTLPN